MDITVIIVASILFWIFTTIFTLVTFLVVGIYDDLPAPIWSRLALLLSPLTFVVMVIILIIFAFVSFTIFILKGKF